MDGGRRHCLRLRAELERLCRVSLHELWIIDLSLPFSQLTTNVDDECEHGRIRCELQVQFGRAARPACRTGSVPAGAPSPALVYKSPPASYAYDWSGFYLGSDGGYGWATPKGTLTDATGVPLTPYSYGVNGPLAGLFVGGNYQFNKFVLGVEGDWQWSNLIGNSQTLAPLGAAGAFPAGPFTISTTVKDYASVRGRLGFAFDRFLVIRHRRMGMGQSFDVLRPRRRGSVRQQGGNSTGWTAGAGVDYAFTDSVFGRIEYRYTNLATSGFVKRRDQFGRCRQSSADQRFARRHRI